ncbi:sulfite exporter TauE/SafE family protein [Microbacterium sp.]|uniref:sulfite exporter TauE/SafE family protein n=1 Tax=Microbacterium sp. TaxID=51671 RepID=UPI0027368122|nr:sulfite exporter TauE/SafE family protein [Microbacterium sp.]MDP3950960.1 sulfite exporter TauE/SafE family protein [Microbacterium sp.]
MILALVCVAALVAAVIQRVTGLAFILVLIGPAVLVYGPIQGVTVAVLLAIVASAIALPSAWRQVDWRRTLWLLGAGLVAAPFGALLTRILPEPALLFTIAGMAAVALLAHRLGGVAAASLRGGRGAILAGGVAGFMHASSGLSGPALAAFAVGDRWDQRRFAASAQVILLGYGLVSVLLRGLPSIPAGDLTLLGACTAVGILGGALLTKVIPVALARRVMLWCAWAGTVVVFARGLLALAT